MHTISYIMIRVGGDLEQHFAGMFDSTEPDFQKRFDEVMNDDELHLVRIEHDGTLPSIYWAEVTLADTESL